MTFFKLIFKERKKESAGYKTREFGTERKIYFMQGHKKRM
jgi:hypothetical protein